MKIIAATDLNAAGDNARKPRRPRACAASWPANLFWNALPLAGYYGLRPPV